MTNPLPAFRFQVEWGGARIGFSEVSGLGVEVGVIEYREGNSRTAAPRKIPGMHKFGNVTLKRGIIASDNDFFDWISTAVSGAAERRDLVVSLLDEQGQSVVRWKLRSVLPVKYRASDLRANANEIAMEELVLAHEGLVVEGS